VPGDKTFFPHGPGRLFDLSPPSFAGPAKYGKPLAVCGNKNQEKAMTKKVANVKTCRFFPARRCW